jgi:hypothetical protein
MFFLVDDKQKIIFGWSAKCGCSHVANMYWFLQTNNTENVIHTQNDVNKLPLDIENYTTLIFIRNPYKRIVSGFLDKYKQEGQYRHLWKHSTVSFSKFVDELVKKNWEMINKHHFTPQTSEHFDIKILKSKNFHLYDIEKIDYKYIEKLYNKKIPEVVLNKKFGHERDFNPKTDSLNNYVYDLNIDEYINFNIDIKYFYNDKLKNAIFEFYKNDFIFFKENGIIYIDSHF